MKSIYSTLRVLALLPALCGAACSPEGNQAGDLAAPDSLPDAGASACTVAPGSLPPGTWAYSVGYVTDPTIELQTESGTAKLGDYYEPCATRSRLLVVRLLAAWCGPCKWQAAHTAELLNSDIKERIIVQDIMVADEQNRPPNPEQIKGFERLYDKVPHLATYEAGVRLLSTYGAGVNAKEYLPMILIIDTKTLRMEQLLSNPDPDTFSWELRRTLARLDGQPEPPAPNKVLYDGRFTRDRWEQIQQMALPAVPVPPSDPTNSYEANTDAAALGKLLFNDAALSSAGSVSCATCHSAAKAFGDGLITAAGVNPSGMPTVGDRNTPWLGGVAFSRFQFWDGRADSLWAQALGPFENDLEMSGNRLFVVRTALSRYQTQYSQLFGAAPELSDLSRFPANARPGMPAWEAMAPADRATVNRAYSNLGKAIAAFERRIVPQPVALDRYARGELTALTENEKDGLAYFFDIGCVQCHHGPMLSDDSFHSNYFLTGRQDGHPDQGRANALPILSASEFRGDGIYSDAPAAADWLKSYGNPYYAPTGQFKTSTLRGIADTAPYTHGGKKATLEDVVELYAAGGMPDGDLSTTGNRDIAIVRFKKDDPKNQFLVQFLKSFKATLSTP